MVIRAKDQASRVINTMSRGVSGDFKRLQTAATLAAQRSAIDMARVRQNYAQQILHQQKLLNTAMSAGNTQRVKYRQAAIRDLRAMQQEEVLRVRQEQIVQKEIMATARANAEAKRAVLDSKLEAARAAGVWVAAGATMALAGAAGVRMLHSWAMASVEYQRQATLTQTQLGKQEASVQRLQEISTNVAKSVGVPIMSMQDALYDIFSSTDIKVNESQAVLDQFAKAAVGGQVSIQEASGAAISVMNGYQKSTADLTRIMDIQFAAVRLGRMTYQELATSIGKAIPSAVAANQSFEELAGSMAFLTRAGLTAAQSAISFARLSDLFTRGDVPQELKELGIAAFDSTGKLRPLSVLLTELSKKFKNLNAAQRWEKFKEIFGGQGTIQARRFFNLAMDNADALVRYIDEVTKSTGDFQKAYDKMAGTVAVKTVVLKNQWEIFKMTMGDAAIPVLTRLIEVGTKVLNWFNGLDASQRKLLGSTLGFVSALLAVSGAVIALSGAVKMVKASFDILTLSGQGVIGMLRALTGASVAARLGLLGLIGAATAYAAVKLNEELHKAADESERTGRMMTLGGKGGQFFAERVSGLSFAANKASEALAKQLPKITDNREGLAGLATHAQVASGRVKTLANAHTVLAPKMGQVIKLTDEEREKFNQLATDIVVKGIEGIADRQDKIAEATQRLREAQADLAEVQRGGSGTASSLATAQERVHDASVRVEKAQISLGDKAKDSRLEHIRLREAQHDLIKAQEAARGSNTKSVASSDELRGAIQRVKDAQKALKDATGETAEEFLARLREEETAAQKWSINMRTLIEKGVDPSLVAELAKQGPAHVAKFVGKSKQFYADLNVAWNNRTAAMEDSIGMLALAASGEIHNFVKNGKLDLGDLASAVGSKTGDARKKAVDNVVRTERAWKASWGDMSRETKRAMDAAGEDTSRFRVKANSELGGIKNIKRYVGLQAIFKPPTSGPFRSLHDIVGATGGYVTPHGIYPLKRAAGGIIDRGSGPTADDVLARLSRGEYVVNARATAKHRDTLEQINREGLPGYARGGAVDIGVRVPNMSRFADRIQSIINTLGSIVERGLERNFKFLAEGFVGKGKQSILRWIRAQDPKPYIWGGAGPGGFDCSGLVSAVHGLVKGLAGAGSGLRLYTTGTIRSGIHGLKSGLGGILQIGVTPGRGHMAGRYAGLGFEAESTRTGIKIGAAASRPESFARHYHLARGGFIDPQALETMAQIAAMSGVDIGGDADRIRMAVRGKGTYLFHRGGRLPEDIFGFGPSGTSYALQRGETVTPSSGVVTVNINGPVYGADADQLADKIQQALLRKKRRGGGVKLGLT